MAPLMKAQAPLEQAHMQLAESISKGQGLLSGTGSPVVISVLFVQSSQTKFYLNPIWTS